MRALTYDHYGPDAELTVRDLPTPPVGPGYVRIRVRRASVNPVDWKLMTGALEQWIPARFPVVPGWDVAGVVDAVGFDTPEVAVGDRVAAYARMRELGAGTFAEYVTVPAEFVAPIPDGVSDDDAAALPLAGLAARRTLDALDLRAGQTLLVHAASGGVGHLAVQEAIVDGVRVIGTGGEGSQEYLRGLGAEPVVYGEGLVERVRALAPEGVDVVADFVGGVQEQSRALVSDPRRIASLADPEVVDHGGHYVWVRPDGPGLARLLGLVADGRLRVRVDRTVDLADVPEAFRASRDGDVAGKIVVRVAD